jgi:hypothetical protein
MTGLPSRMTSVVTATTEHVIFEKSMNALAIGEAIGTVFSRISVIRTSILFAGWHQQTIHKARPGVLGHAEIEVLAKADRAA